jgi:uncharacterized phage protein (TIGR01671 family)|nr:MAG TPA: YopX protein [Caudoviricetes sp.]
MNREIKFRGKSIDEWVYGMLCKVNEGDTEHGEPIKYKIQTDEKEYGEYVNCFITDENTIGQYTGLHDKNGKEIYEGDIVKIKYRDEDIGKVIYEHNGFSIDVTNMNKNYWRVSFVNNFIEVIGNIYENPELLGGMNGI